ncbi:hypothetical protein LCGC14_1554940 [marine sediment metagenome]|uniref:Uncharacterized protein n=1 Tax=marine sediment metagenome TaxID=412755 RepID=A0A0F9L5F1_9ZZZZ
MKVEIRLVYNNETIQTQTTQIDKHPSRLLVQKIDITKQIDKFKTVATKNAKIALLKRLTREIFKPSRKKPTTHLPPKKKPS